MEFGNETHQFDHDYHYKCITHIKVVAYTSLVLVVVLVLGIVSWFLRYLYKKRKNIERQLSQSDAHFTFGMRPISFRDMNMGY